MPGHFMNGNINLYDETAGVPISDEKFRTVNTKLGDKNNDGVFSELEACYIDILKCDGMTIESLSGIEYCKYLTSLSCADNLLSDLDLNQNARLKKINCSNNKLATINIA